MCCITCNEYFRNALHEQSENVTVTVIETFIITYQKLMQGIITYWKLESHLNILGSLQLSHDA